jgi:hypothetical protein
MKNVNLLESIGQEAGLTSLGHLQKQSYSAVFAAIVSACNKTGISTCSTVEIRNIFEEEKTLLDVTRNGGRPHGRYNILSFSDRLTKITSPLAAAGFFIETKKKGKLHYSLTQKSIDLIVKICTKENVSLLLTSTLSYERDFATFSTKNLSLREVLSFKDLNEIKNSCSEYLSPSLLEKLSNSLEYQVITKTA